MTVDVEDYFHVSAFSSSVDPGDWTGLESRVERNTRRLLELFGLRGVRATFFVLGWVAERYPGLVREIGAAGHEVGCHGYSHQLIYRQQRSEFAAETRRAKSVIEQALGARVRGYRAASFSITSQTLWALDEIAAAGFEYDSSVAPMRHDIYGWLNGPRVPTRLRTESGAELVEFPVMLARWGRVSLPVAGAVTSGSSPMRSCGAASRGSTAASGSRSSSICTRGKSTRTSRASRRGSSPACDITRASRAVRPGSGG